MGKIGWPVLHIPLLVRKSQSNRVWYFRAFDIIFVSKGWNLSEYLIDKNDRVYKYTFSTPLYWYWIVNRLKNGVIIHIKIKKTNKWDGYNV